MDKIICLVGASGSGKTTIAKELEGKGYNIIHSYTTREERVPGEWGHIFTSLNNNVFLKESPDRFEKEMIESNYIIAFKEVYEGLYYWATKEQYQGKGTSIYVVDPDGAKQVKKNVKGVEVVTIFLQADRVHRMGRLRERFYKANKIESFKDTKRNKRLVNNFRDELRGRINSDSEIFKTCKCDYVVDGNNSVEEVLKSIIGIIGCDKD